MTSNNYDPNYSGEKNYVRLGQKAIVLNKLNDILLLQRSEKAGSGGKWSLPGGGLDKDEEPVSSISREIEEEASIRVSNLRPFSVKSYISEGDRIVIMGYICICVSADVELNWEHDQYKWVPYKDIFTFDLIEDALYFLEEVKYLL